MSRRKRSMRRTKRRRRRMRMKNRRRRRKRMRRRFSKKSCATNKEVQGVGGAMGGTVLENPADGHQAW